MEGGRSKCAQGTSINTHLCFNVQHTQPPVLAQRNQFYCASFLSPRYFIEAAITVRKWPASLFPFHILTCEVKHAPDFSFLCALYTSWSVIDNLYMRTTFAHKLRNPFSWTLLYSRT
ncbi:hypothetical protein K440DRAFT_85141 [Wilcoxina mikolae CBS 423.85]|nr:hypothetical protein K440DRAFT_85141 [Wilcoxina mikolae CBS 423.85]